MDKTNCGNPFPRRHPSSSWGKEWVMGCGWWMFRLVGNPLNLLNSGSEVSTEKMDPKKHLMKKPSIQRTWNASTICIHHLRFPPFASTICINLATTDMSRIIVVRDCFGLMVWVCRNLMKFALTVTPFIRPFQEYAVLETCTGMYRSHLVMLHAFTIIQIQQDILYIYIYTFIYLRI